MADKNREQKRRYNEYLKVHAEFEGSTSSNLPNLFEKGTHKKVGEVNSTHAKNKEAETDEESIVRKGKVPRISVKAKLLDAKKQIINAAIGAVLSAIIIGLPTFFLNQYLAIRDLKKGFDDLNKQVYSLEEKYKTEKNLISVEVIKNDILSLKERISLIERVFFNKNYGQ